MSTKAKGPTYRKYGEANVFELIWIVLFLVVGIGYGVIAMSTRDLMWFRANDSFDARPQVIEIYHNGEKTLLSPGSAAYERLTAEINSQMGTMAGYYEHSLPERILAESYESSTLVLMIYEQPLDIHTQWNLGEPNMLLIPITGAGSFANRVYTGTDRRFGHGALILKDMTPLVTLVQDDLGFQDE